MKITTVSVTKVPDKMHTATLATSLLGVFVLGLILGALSTNLLELGTHAQLNATLAGVGIVDTTSKVASSEAMSSGETLDSQSESTEVLSNTPADVGGDTEVPFPETGEVAGAETVAEREERNLTKEGQDRLVSEIKLLKDASVTLVAEFLQNCGVWTDICAEPYQIQLEKNNSRYEALERSLLTFPNY